MCVKIKYKNGSEKKYDPDQELDAQLENMESVKIEGKVTRKEKKMVLNLAAKEIRRAQEKIEKNFEELSLNLKQIGKK